MSNRRQEEMLELRTKILEENLEITKAYDLAPLMGEYEKDYWNWQLITAYNKWKEQNEISRRNARRSAGTQHS